MRCPWVILSNSKAKLMMNRTYILVMPSSESPAGWHLLYRNIWWFGASNSVLEYLYWTGKTRSTSASQYMDFAWSLARWAIQPTPGNSLILLDFCNGSYTQYCDLRRQYDPTPSPNTTNALPNGTVVPAYKGPAISTFIEAAKRYDLLAWMNKYWINQGAPNSDFWGHEFSKHATCFSTFQVSVRSALMIK